MLDRFKEILKLHGLQGKDVSKELGISHGSYRSMLSSKKTKLKWVKAFLLGYRLGSLRGIEVKDEEVL